MGRQSRNICWLRERMERNFIFRLLDLKCDLARLSRRLLTYSPKPTQHITTEASACINSGSEEGRWSLCFPTSAGTSSLPYLSLGELWKPPTKSSSLYETLTGKDRRSLRTTNKQCFRKVGSCLGRAHRGGRVLKPQVPARSPSAGANHREWPSFLCLYLALTFILAHVTTYHVHICLLNCRLTGRETLSSFICNPSRSLCQRRQASRICWTKALQAAQRAHLL